MPNLGAYRVFWGVKIYLFTVSMQEKEIKNRAFRKKIACGHPPHYYPSMHVLYFADWTGMKHGKVVLNFVYIMCETSKKEPLGGR